MELVTGRAGNPHITSQQDRQKHQGVWGTGAYILKTGNNLEPVVQSSNSIQIKDGALMTQGALISVKVGTVDEVTIANGSQGMQRKDVIVARYTYNQGANTEKAKWAVVQGTPVASNPQIPQITEGDIQAGDATVDTAVFIVTLDGINITAVDVVPETAPDLEEIKAQLDALNGKTSQFFSASEANSIEITAPYDCTVEVTHTFLGWGYAGNLYVFSISSTSSGITKKADNVGGCEGGDTINKYLRADAIFSGLKKGEKYTFSRQDISGTSGANNNRKWTVICHPE